MKLQRRGRGKEESGDVEPSWMKTGEGNIHSQCAEMAEETLRND